MTLLAQAVADVGLWAEAKRTLASTCACRLSTTLGSRVGSGRSSTVSVALIVAWVTSGRSLGRHQRGHAVADDVTVRPLTVATAGLLLEKVMAPVLLLVGLGRSNAGSPKIFT